MVNGLQAIGFVIPEWFYRESRIWIPAFPPKDGSVRLLADAGMTTTEPKQ